MKNKLKIKINIILKKTIKFYKINYIRGYKYFLTVIYSI